LNAQKKLKETKDKIASLQKNISANSSLPATPAISAPLGNPAPPAPTTSKA